MLIDVHCHLDHHYYKNDLDEVINNAKKSGVLKIITSGIDRNTCEFALSLSKKYNIVEAALGRYPEDALDREGYYKNNPDIKRTTIEQDLEFMKQHKNEFVAIGECGIDLFNGHIDNLEKQSNVFRKLIELSIELDKPIIIHSRKAERQVIEILEEYKDKLKPENVIMHCFSGRKSLIKISIENGYKFSIPTNIGRAQNFQWIVKEAPIKNILTETDAPYLSPYKNEDGSFNRNEPSYVNETIKIIAKIKGITEEECKKQIYMNYQMTFLKNK
jgi:TatD DNase family protein